MLLPAPPGFVSRLLNPSKEHGVHQPRVEHLAGSCRKLPNSIVAGIGARTNETHMSNAWQLDHSIFNPTGVQRFPADSPCDMTLAGCKVPEGNHQLSQERLKELAIEPAGKRIHADRYNWSKHSTQRNPFPEGKSNLGVFLLRMPRRTPGRRSEGREPTKQRSSDRPWGCTRRIPDVH